jgi:hypothetical protein
MNHTPTPWVCTQRRHEAFVWKQGDEVEGSNRIAIATIQYNSQANAEHVCRCVNAHDELVAALKEVLYDICDFHQNNPEMRGELSWTVRRIGEILDNLKE